MFHIVICCRFTVIFTSGCLLSEELMTCSNTAVVQLFPDRCVTAFVCRYFRRKMKSECLLCLFILVPPPPHPRFSFVCLQKTMLCPCTQTHACQHMNMQVYMHTQICTPTGKYMKSKMWKQQCVCIFFQVSRSPFAESVGDSSFADSYAQGLLYAMAWLYLCTH